MGWENLPVFIIRMKAERRDGEYRGRRLRDYIKTGVRGGRDREMGD